jgi:hypothetical protein
MNDPVLSNIMYGEFSLDITYLPKEEIQRLRDAGLNVEVHPITPEEHS